MMEYSPMTHMAGMNGKLEKRTFLTALYEKVLQDVDPDVQSPHTGNLQDKKIKQILLSFPYTHFKLVRIRILPVDHLS